MNVNVHVHVEPDPRIDELLALVRGLTMQGEETMADLSALATEIADNTEVTASASTLIQRLADEIEAAGTDQAALDALVEQLRSNDTTLADAVVANTPAEETPTVDPNEEAPA